MTGRHRFRNRRMQHTALHRAVDVVDARTRASLRPTARHGRVGRVDPGPDRVARPTMSRHSDRVGGTR
jgi:hypothetical protein